MLKKGAKIATNEKTKADFLPSSFSFKTLLFLFWLESTTL